jgi:hypothetical protein
MCFFLNITLLNSTFSSNCEILNIIGMLIHEELLLIEIQLPQEQKEPIHLLVKVNNYILPGVIGAATVELIPSGWDTWSYSLKKLDLALNLARIDEIKSIPYF